MPTPIETLKVFLNHNFSQEKRSPISSLSEKELFCLKSIAPLEDVQKLFIDHIDRFHEGLDLIREINHQLNQRTNNSETQAEILDQINQALTYFIDNSGFEAPYTDWRFTSPFCAYADVIANMILDPKLFELFDQDPQKVGQVVPKLFNPSDVSSNSFVNLFRNFLRKAKTAESVKGLVGLSREEIDFIYEYEEIFLSFPEIFTIFEKYQRSPQGWGDRYLMFHDLCVAVGSLPIGTQALTDLLIQQMSPEKRQTYQQKSEAGRFLTIASIRRNKGYDQLLRLSKSDPLLLESESQRQLEIARSITQLENPNLPVITSGIAATIGSEVEFPYFQSRLHKSIPQGFISFTEGLGIHWGTGGSNCAEIAPGPFYHPETMVFFHRLMQDLGFIDYHQYLGMTFHFNTPVQREYLLYLVFGLYMANIMSSPNMFSSITLEEGFRPQIYEGNDGQVEDYTECKSFLCYTPEDTDRGTIQAGYISWALRNYQLSLRQRHPPKRVRQMAAIGHQYINTISAGARAVGLQGLFNRDDEDYVRPEAINRLVDLVSEVVPDYRARYLDTKNIDSSSPVLIRGKSWPNLVAFARDAGELAVQRVKMVEEEMNREATRLIVSISRSSGRERRKK